MSLAQAVAVAPLLGEASVRLGDGSVIPIPLRFADAPRTDGGFDFSSELLVFGDGSVRVAGAFKSDPFIDFSVTVIDFGAPSSFTFQFLTPTVGGPFNTAVNQLDASQVSAAATNLLLKAGYGTDGPSSADDPDLEISASSCAPPGCGPFDRSKSGSFPSGSMTSTFSFTGAGGDSTYAFTGRFELSNERRLPEPAGLVLTVMGLALLGVARRPRGSA